MKDLAIHLRSFATCLSQNRLLAAKQILYSRLCSSQRHLEVAVARTDRDVSVAAAASTAPAEHAPTSPSSKSCKVHTQLTLRPHVLMAANYHQRDWSVMLTSEGCAPRPATPRRATTRFAEFRRREDASQSSEISIQCPQRLIGDVMFI